MRAMCFNAACALLILSAGSALAQDKAATAGGSGQGQAGPSTEAKPPAVTAPVQAETAGGKGQSQAGPSSEAKTLAPVQGGAAQDECPAGQTRNPAGACQP